MSLVSFLYTKYIMAEELYINTKYYFGKNAIVGNLSKEINDWKVKTLFLLYGSSSIKKNGIYDAILKELKKTKVKIVEHSGIKPNPLASDCDKAIALGKKHKVDMILAVGGGSVIDEAKVVSTCIANPQIKKTWDFLEAEHAPSDKHIPIMSIITLAATGSESNATAVITNTETKDKWGVGTPVRPCVCFEDPTYTFTVSQWQTGSGIFDIFSHLIEQYYDMEYDFEWTKQYLIANMKVLLKYAKTVMKYPRDYRARANILWTSTWALNGLGSFNIAGDWNCHGMEHALSAKYDVSHGAGLALITPTYIEYMCSQYEAFRVMTLELAKELFHVNSVKKFLHHLIAFIKMLKLPTRYSDFKEIGKVTKEDIGELCEIFDRNTEGKHDIGVKVFNRIPK